tara:strand:- start:687 stop:902 length:216 start_codon:yes stop_codon:yes gene_type:complete
MKKLTDDFISELVNNDSKKDIFYSDEKPVTLNGVSGRIGILVRPRSKTFIFRFKTMKYTLGKFIEGSFGIT